MADSAAHLRDCVFPCVPARQWVFTLPKGLRFLLAWRPKLISLMLRLFLRALFAWQRRCARRQGLRAPLCGAVSFIQRFGSSLNLNIHVHAILPDGVFFEDEDGRVQFHPLLPPKYSDLEKLIRKLVRGPYRLPWATLLRRVFAIEVLTCDRCGGKRRLVALIDKDAAIQKILAHLGLPTQPPAEWPARAPPRAADCVDWLPQDGIDPIPGDWYI
jgi:hypothetical protein